MIATTERNKYCSAPLMARLFGERGMTYITSMTIYRGSAALPKPNTTTTNKT